MAYYTHISKAYEILYDNHKRAIYDDESIPDEEFFTIYIGPVPINLFMVFSISCVGAVGYFGFRYF